MDSGGIWARTPEIDRRIEDFNAEVGV